MRRYYILLALSKEPLHGMGVQQQVLSDSFSSLYMRDNNVYRLIADMERHGYIEPAGEEPGLGGRAGTRKLYKLTKTGRKLLRAGAHDFREFSRLALERLPD
jgi:DNA-binding PadR family transcriptional regulator